jgi:hypothetical protein
MGDDADRTAGQAGSTLDQAALFGLVLRITGLELDVVDMHRVVPQPDD